jgi:hypothetical protein
MLHNFMSTLITEKEKESVTLECKYETKDISVPRKIFGYCGEKMWCTE